MSAPTEHVPVLCSEAMQYLAVPAGAWVVDATIGLGGHAALMLERIGAQGMLIGLDVDEDNLRRANERLGRYPNARLFHENFQNIEAVLEELGITAVSTVLADLGFSSNQMDNAARGFSLYSDGPLDMRLDRRSQSTAADLVNRLSESALADLLFHNGQERASRRIARAIHGARREHRITTTKHLAEIVCRALKKDPQDHRERIHPATRTFLALRIAVNHELESLERFLAALPRVLKPGGRAGVISFHSLEDGLCKRAFRRMHQDGLVQIVTKKPIGPSADERRANPRSRSAKLRVIERASKE